MSDNTEPRPPWYRKGVAVALVLYWVTMFILTHVPKVPRPLPPGFTDKWQHYAAYAGLGFLLATWWTLRRPLTWRAGLGLFVVAVFYGAFDEVTQPLFHRDADLLDWRSDIIGAATGVALYAIVTTAINRRKQWPGERGASAP